MNFRIGLLIFVTAVTASTDGLSREASLRAFETLDMPGANARAPETLQIRAFGRLFSLELTPNDDLMTALPAGQRNRLGAGDLFLKGTLSGRPGSWVRLNRIDGQFSGGFHDGDELYLIDSAAGLVPPGQRAAADDAAILFRMSDLDLPIHVDDGAVAVDDTRTGTAATTDYATFVGHLREVATLEGTAMLAMPVTIVSDVGFSNRHGSNTASTVLGRINFIDGIYANQLGLGIELWHHEILNANGALTSSDAGELLEQFGSFLNGGAGSDIPFRGLAHLFTGRDLDGNTVGVAFLSGGSRTVLCQRNAGLGVDQDLDNQTVASLVFAHEVGHNFNARHDDNESACPDLPAEEFGIMSSMIGSSQEFSACSIPVMEQALDLVTGEPDCLVEVTATDGIFTDGFEP
ncbi:MAG: hypothetical protein KGY48_03135 [Wenzhouxiangellaceae bacterium]|nr:hypothetical protein [Wenzhouxiangellaceae bacterium]